MGTATNVIMPVLGMSQDSGKLVHWLKKAGERIEKGEPLMEVETDKATVEIESPASGILTNVTAQEGDDVPVTQVIAVIQDGKDEATPSTISSSLAQNVPADIISTLVSISPLAARMALENKLDPSQIKPEGGRIEKTDVLAYLAKHAIMPSSDRRNGRVLASPKARRLAQESNQDISGLQGSGPDGVILAQDVERSMAKVPAAQTPLPAASTSAPVQKMPEGLPASQPVHTSTIWRRMAEHTTDSWTTAPHFYLQRSVKVSRLLAWHAYLQENSQQKITINDLLVLVTSRALSRHPKINVTWQDEKINILNEINISLAVAVGDGLVVPVIHHADRLSVFEIATERKELVTRAQSGKLRLEDITGGTFTISNLGMFGVDSFNAVLNGPQAAILAVGRIAEQVIPVNGAPVIQPIMNLSVSFDHRAVDGAGGAKFLETLADMIEEPLTLVS
jgi:pyruvate dehydrogenase E2 component (dihydrolipoamide acetyltransferase)